MEVRELLEALVVDGQIRIRIDIYNHTVQPPTTATTVIQTPGEPRSNGKEPPTMSDFVLQDDQEVITAIAPGDVVGNPVPDAVFDAGSVTVTSAVPAVLAVEVSTDQTSYTATAVGPEETGVVVTVNGTVNGNPVTSTLTYDVTASPISTVIQTPGTPTTIPGDAGTPPSTTNPPVSTDTTNPPPPAS